MSRQPQRARTFDDIVKRVCLIHRLEDLFTMRLGSTGKVPLKCKLEYYRISECSWGAAICQPHTFKQACQLSQVCGWTVCIQRGP